MGAALAALSGPPCGAALQPDVLEFDSMLHDFGQILLSDGPVSCTFTCRNVSKKPVAIYAVTTSCGCTSVKWSREPILPGKSATISATYSNDEGAYPFDKTLTVSLAGISKPVLLHMRGIACKKIRPDSEIYTTLFGPGGEIGLEQNKFKCSNLEEGGSGVQQASAANLSKKSVSLSFEGVTDGLYIEVSPNPIPAGSHATLQFTVQSRPGKWGTNMYEATPVVNGVSSSGKISVSAFTTIAYTGLDKEAKAAGPLPYFKESTFSYNHRKQGAKISATFECENRGKQPLHILKAESDSGDAVSLPSSFPAIEPGRKARFTIELDTTTLPVGEALSIVTLVTDSPSRPIVNLFIAGWITK